MPASQPGAITAMIRSQHYEPACDLSLLSDHPDNPRRGDLAAVTDSIDVNGFYGAILAQRSTGRILAGHTRRRALLRKGQNAGPVLWLDVDDDTARRILLADNRTAELATWDTSQLTALLTGMSSQPGELTGTGFTAEALAELAGNGSSATGELLDVLDVTIADPRHVTARGEIWALGRHRLIVESVVDEWPDWISFLEPGALLLVHASAFAPLAPDLARRKLIMIQPEPYIAGHMLDLWASVNGEPQRIRMPA